MIDISSNNRIAFFDYKEIKVRTVIINGEIWFVAKDLCLVLDIANSRDAVSRLSEKMKLTLQGKESLVGLTDDPNITQLSLISEPGMYKLVFKSRKPEAEKFSDRVANRCVDYIIKRTDEYVLPYLQNTFPGVIEDKLNNLEN